MRAQIHYPAFSFLVTRMCTALLMFFGVASAQVAWGQAEFIAPFSLFGFEDAQEFGPFFNEIPPNPDHKDFIFKGMAENPGVEVRSLQINFDYIDPNGNSVIFEGDLNVLPGVLGPQLIAATARLEFCPEQVTIHFETINGSILDIQGTFTHTCVPVFIPGGDLPMPKDQQKCVNNLNKGAGKVVKAQGGAILACLKNAARERLLGVTLEDCLTTDPQGQAKVQKALGKLDDKVGPGSGCDSANAPRFGFSSAATGGQASIVKELRLVHSIFGSDLDSGVIVTDKPGSKCQQGVMKAVQKCQDTKIKEFNKCKKAGLKGKTPPGQISSKEDLERLCLQSDPDDPTTPQPDPKGKINGKCIVGIQKAIDKKCGGLDTAALFPGCEGPVSVACLDPLVECAFCGYANATDDLFRNCDLFDNGEADGSCSKECTKNCEFQEKFTYDYECVGAGDPKTNEVIKITDFDFNFRLVRMGVTAEDGTKCCEPEIQGTTDPPTDEYKFTCGTNVCDVRKAVFYLIDTVFTVPAAERYACAGVTFQAICKGVPRPILWPTPTDDDPTPKLPDRCPRTNDIHKIETPTCADGFDSIDIKFEHKLECKCLDGNIESGKLLAEVRFKDGVVKFGGVAANDDLDCNGTKTAMRLIPPGDPKKVACKNK